jgi:hypothetical protein
VFNTAPLANGFEQPIEQVEDGPQTANVPILAWVGEDVRLVACDDNIVPNPLDDNSIVFQQASWHTGLWTGDQAFQSTPTFDGSQSTNLYITNTGSASFFFPTGVDNAGYRPVKGCTSTDISSLHAGLDEVGLDVTQQVVGNRLQLDPTPVYSQQFIVIWMTANKPSLTESSVHSLGFPTTAGSTNVTTAPSDQLTPAVNTGSTAHPDWVGGHYNADQFLGDEGPPDTTNPLGTFNSLDAWGADSPFNPFTALNPFDPANGNITPTSNNGLIDVKVTGSFPIEDAPPSTTNENYFAPVTGGGSAATSITLPDQWPALATLMATSSTQYTSNGSTTGGDLWDIHGGPTNTLAVDGHAGPGVGPFATCRNDGTNFLQSTDVVDDCVSNHGVGNPYAFSRVFGDVTGIGLTVGPYDSEDPNATLLSDGKLNTDDAPMPALPVFVSIAKGGIGGLYGVSKYLVYSHDFNGGPASPLALPTNPLESDGKTANLYNPYYAEYIPSTLRPIQEASGVTGVYEGGIFAGSSGDDFPGFANGDTDAYEFWKALQVTTDDTYGSNGCLEYDEGTAGFNQGDDHGDFLNQAPPQFVLPRTGLSFYKTPYYPTSLMVYTDERGEAFVDYNPGTGFNTPPVKIDANGACDLQALYGQPIGTATISAQTEYPYQAVPYTPPAGANTLTKTTLSQWSKTLTVLPKGNASQAGSGSDINVVVAHAQNVNGTPFSDELVCVSSPPNETVTWLKPISTTIPPGPVVIGGFDITNSSDYSGNSVAPTDSACGYTSSFGNVAFDVSGSLSPTNVDIQAEFVPEHIFRDVVIPTLGQTTTVTSTTPPTVLPADKVVLSSGSDGGSGSAAGSSNSSSSNSSAPSASVAPTAPLSVGSGNSCKVNSVHLYAKKGYVQLKVSCTKSKTDSIVLRTIRSNGKIMHSYRKTIAAGKSVRIYLSTRKVARVSVSA